MAGNCGNYSLNLEKSLKIQISWRDIYDHYPPQKLKNHDLQKVQNLLQETVAVSRARN
jgi:hypothetical protein